MNAQYQVGQLVIVEQENSIRRLGGHQASKQGKVMEVGSIDILAEDSVCFPAGVYYRLRRPGGKGKGGQVLHSEASLAPAE